jgi:hypothetical protein
MPDEIDVKVRVSRDAAALLIEAADALDKPQPLGEPMKLIEPALSETEIAALCGGQKAAARLTGPPLTFTDPGPPAAMTRISRSCPKCGSRANKTVHVQAHTLECPVCAYQWPYVMEGKWI